VRGGKPRKEMPLGKPRKEMPLRGFLWQLISLGCPPRWGFISPLLFGNHKEVRNTIERK